jgi:hypothetical protein
MKKMKCICPSKVSLDNRELNSKQRMEDKKYIQQHLYFLTPYSTTLIFPNNMCSITKDLTCTHHA